MDYIKIYYSKFKEPLILLSICILTYFISRINYLLFHSIIELSTVIFGLTLMIIVFATIKVSENSNLTFLGICYGFISLIDIFHIFTYKGLGIILTDTNTPIQLYVSARYYECIVLMLSVKYINKKFNIKSLVILNTICTIFILLGILVFDFFPKCFVEGYGLTNFKIVSEYIISIGLFIVIFLYIKSEDEITKGNKKLFITALLLEVLSELTFNLYIDVYSIADFLGHILKFLSYYYFFKVLLINLIINPYDMLFQKLNKKTVELEKSNKYYKRLMNFIPDGIVVLDGDKIKFGNKRFCEMLQIKDNKNIINSSISKFIHSKYHDLLYKRLNEKDKSILLNPVEYEFINEGNKIFAETSSLAMNGEDREYLIVAIRNITDRKNAEKTKELLREKKKEEEIKSNFFANISHELKTPINVIYSAVQLQNNYLHKLDKESIGKYNKIIDQNCLRLIRLINNLIDITKIETDFFNPIMNIENIVTIVEDITLSVVSYVERKNISLIFDTEEEEIYVRCDKNLIERIMLNVLSNAFKYGKESGNIYVSIWSNDDIVTINIKDNGVGIPEDMQSKIFSRFQKVDKSLSRDNEGTGIGLSLVKSLVELQGGNIRLRSKVDYGTEISISFPIEKECLEIAATMEEPINYEKNISRAIELEFSDIYY